MVRERLQQKLNERGLTVETHTFRGRYDALILGKTILLSVTLKSREERTSETIHEYGHDKATTGNVFDKPPEERSRCEYRADRAGVIECITFDDLLAAYKTGARNGAEFCEALGITEAFFVRALIVYSRMYGVMKEYNGWMFEFSPLKIRRIKKKVGDSIIFDEWEPF